MEGSPVHESGIIDLAEQEYLGAEELDVPAGKTWVIEFVSASLSLSKGDQLRPFEIWTAAGKLGGGTSRPHHYFMPQAIAGSATHVCINQQTRIYAMPGSQVRVEFRRGSTNGPAKIRYTISGRLETS